MAYHWKWELEEKGFKEISWTKYTEWQFKVSEYVDSYLSPSIYHADCGWNHCRYHVFSNAYGTEEYIGLYPNETSTSGRYINVTATSLGGIAETVWNNIFN